LVVLLCAFIADADADDDSASESDLEGFLFTPAADEGDASIPMS
jgi:hypothetical protein